MGASVHPVAFAALVARMQDSNSTEDIPWDDIADACAYHAYRWDYHNRNWRGVCDEHGCDRRAYGIKVDMDDPSLSPLCREHYEEDTAHAEELAPDYYYFRIPDRLMSVGLAYEE